MALAEAITRCLSDGRCRILEKQNKSEQVGNLIFDRTNETTEKPFCQYRITGSKSHLRAFGRDMHKESVTKQPIHKYRH